MSAQVAIEDLKVGMELRATVKRLELYGAFVDIGAGQDALLHISQLGKQNVRNVEDVVKPDEEITVYVIKVEGSKVAVSLVKPPAINWDSIKEGDEVEGEVVRLENFGAFIDIGAERPGMVHVSEMADGYVKSPSDVVKVGEKVNARVLKVNRKKRQIDLTMKSPEVRVELPDEEEEEEVPTAMALALRKAMSGEDAEDTRTANRRNEKERNRRVQDDIISRTLRGNSN